MMMGFKIVEGPARTIWAAGDGSSTYYEGQLVSYIAASKANTNGTVVPLAVPAGVADTTNFQVPAGIVIGFNAINPTWDGTTNFAHYDGGTYVTQAEQLARTDIKLGGGMWGPSDPQLLIKIALIFPHTVLEGPIWNGAVGTAITVVADTGGADTTGYTTAGTQGSVDFTPVADLSTAYCRSGANAGLYRSCNDTIATAMDVEVAFPYDVALGDTFVRVPLKQGLCFAYIAGPGLYIDGAGAAVTNYFDLIVTKLDLREAGKESAQFMFAVVHFDNYRA